MQENRKPLNGVICMNKPKDFTSFDVIAKMRGILKEKRLGHTGTLDPMATGVLPVLVGRASMAADFLPDHDKEYLASFKLGIKTDTEDITGKITEKYNGKFPSREALENVLAGFRGEIKQIPPMYSAVKVDGRKLCDMARKNITVERKARTVTVYSLSLISYDENTGEGEINAVVQKGTYIRTLINDIGEALGTHGVMTSLVRTKACGFSLSDTVNFDELQKIADNGGDFSSVVIPVSEILSCYEKVCLTPEEERLYRNGIRLTTERINAENKSGIVRVFGGKGFFALGEIKDKELIQRKIFVLDECKKSDGYSVALGLFDGLHKGHMSVLEKAKESTFTPAVFTFDSQAFSSDEKNILKCSLASEEKKEEGIKKFGIENVFAPDFNDFKDMSGEEFVKKVLIDRMRAENIVCGEDFRFGKNASCNVNDLKRFAEKYNIAFSAVKTVTNSDGEKISSGIIRKLISQGETEKANSLMSAPFSFEAPVIRGRQLGRTLGFPTINQKIPDYLIVPKFGVYSAVVTINGKTYKGLANVGVKPTVTDKNEILCETFIFDFDEEIYGFRVNTILLRFVREERKFSSLDALKTQVLSDIDDIKGSN